MKILVAYDKNTSFANVLDTAVKRAAQDNAYVYLVRTCSEDAKADEIAELDHRLNEMMVEVFNKQGIQGETHILIRGLTPGEDVVSFAAEKNVDEIIIGIKKRSRVGKMVFGSTAQFIILESHCPVLSVK
ncbi:universal stress protein [Desulfospira joergensenii]|uniref:universal stress protein n=1 Tax=Desulfospira joergensenii TaxID=53329 RepID=UPI0003B737D9|nr:universal stress protein [Desulfospira joergensenii]